MPAHDSTGRSDEDLAAEHWQEFLERNQSVVVDLFQGQFSSKVSVNDVYDVLCSAAAMRVTPRVSCRSSAMLPHGSINSHILNWHELSMLTCLMSDNAGADSFGT